MDTFSDRANASSFNPRRHHRRSVRLRGYDYSAEGAYFLTICTYEHRCLFGEITEGEMQLNDAGRTVEECWKAIPEHFPRVQLDAFVVMPNHVHGILWIIGENGNDGKSAGAKNFSPLRIPSNNPSGKQKFARFESPSRTIGSVLRGFKIGITKWMRVNTPVRNVWQRNYWDHIIRNETALYRIREYIRNNPGQWQGDRSFQDDVSRSE